MRQLAVGEYVFVNELASAESGLAAGVIARRDAVVHRNPVVHQQIADLFEVNR